MELVIESPRPNERVYDHAITVAGIVRACEAPAAVSAFFNGALVGETRLLGQVAPGEFRFRLLARAAAGDAAQSELEIRAGGQSARVPVTFIPSQLDTRPYGEVLTPDRAEVLHRENIYGSGPPVEHPSAEALALVLQYLPARSSVLDFGCGAGAYARGILDAGHNWLGAEIQPACLEILQRRNLPFRAFEAAAGPRLPFADLSFDAAIAIEVLEHITDLDATIAELARVTKTRLLVSVPNMEIIPLFAPLGVVPWHLLEATHVNFFTRASLATALRRHFGRVEVFTYGRHPVVTHDGVPVHLHLFAIAGR